MPAFEKDSAVVSVDAVDIRLECLGKATDPEAIWWVGEGFADGNTKPRGLFRGKPEAESLARQLSDASRLPLREKCWDE